MELLTSSVPIIQIFINNEICRYRRFALDVKSAPKKVIYYENQYSRQMRQFGSLIIHWAVRNADINRTRCTAKLL
jgi:hypothetical protein